jgi:hypothetical protein
LTLGETEQVDTQNRTRWLACVVQHNVWLSCAEQLIEEGKLAAP